MQSPVNDPGIYELYRFNVRHWGHYISKRLHSPSVVGFVAVCSCVSQTSGKYFFYGIAVLQCAELMLHTMILLCEEGQRQGWK